MIDMKKLLLVLSLLLASSGGAWAQNTQCSDRAASDSSNACANTRFVQGAISGTITGTITQSATGFWYAPQSRINRLADRVFIGDAINNAGTNVASQPDWLTTWQLSHGASFGYIQTSQAAILNNNRSTALQALTTGAQTLNTTTGGNAVGLASFGINNKPADSVFGYGIYAEGHRCATCIGGAYGAELNAVNFNSSIVTIDPYIQNSGQTIGIQLAAGGDVYTGQFNSTAAVNIRDNNAKFRSGIIFGSAVLDTTGNPQPDALALADNYSITWYNSTASKQWKYIQILPI